MTALQAAQEYLDWHMMDKPRTAVRVLVGLKPRVHFEILCEDGVCVEVDAGYHDKMAAVLKREMAEVVAVVEANRARVKAEELAG